MTQHSTSIEEAMRRTSLSSSNQMEMLTFRLTDKQLYGINVFKIIEIIECPNNLSRVPYSHPAVKGVVDFRGEAITVIDMAAAIDMEPIDNVNNLGYLVVCEYNRQLNAFLVSQPESLLTRGWDEIKKPEGFHAPALIAITHTDDNEMILLLDIEGILTTVVGIGSESAAHPSVPETEKCKGKKVVLLDDSSSAMQLLANTMEQLGIDYTSFDSAPKALSFLTEQVEKNNPIPIDLIISDIEMPEMDGFTFTRTVRKMVELKRIPIVLHSSMSNPTNQHKSVEAGADRFIAKFDPIALRKLVCELLSE